jgi:glutamate 5-kinase
VRRPIPAGAPVVVKVGSSSLAAVGGGIDTAAVDAVVQLVSDCLAASHPTVLVTSGAVAAGVPALRLERRPADLAGLQAAAAVGQGKLMERYSAGFSERDRVAGQVLLTRDVLGNRDQYLNARAALERMLGLGIVPVVNENDAVAVEELRLGDNDRLAAVVSHLVSAGLLLILTDTEGLFTSDPRLASGQFLEAVTHDDPVLDNLSGTGPIGSGGVAGKVAAARMAAWSAVPTVIVSAKAPGLLSKVLAGEDIGTWVDPRPQKLAARKLWIAFGLSPAGTVVVDGGAVAALVEKARSLLPVGIIEVRGSFPRGSAVDIVGPDDALVAKGLVALDSVSLQGLIGQRGIREAVHRDDLVILR